MSRRFTGGTLSSGILYVDGGYLSSATVPVTGFPFTMACWASAADASNFNPVMAFSDEGSANDGIILSIDSEVVYLRYIVGGSFGLLSTAAADATGYYIALVCTSATDKKLYVNGTLVGTITDNLGFPSALDRYYVGAEYRATRFTAHDVTVALPVVYNAALTEAEVKRLAAGVYPECVRGSSIAAFHGLFRACSPEPDISGGTNDLTVSGTGTAATGASAPTINYSSPIYLESVTIDEERDLSGNYIIDTITATVSSTALTLETFGFTAANVASAKTAVVCAQNAAVMVTRGASETPTSTHGFLVNSGQTKSFPLINGASNFKVIRQGGDATVTIELLA